MEAIGPRLLGLSVFHLLKTFDEWKSQPTGDSSREVGNKSLLPLRRDASQPARHRVRLPASANQIRGDFDKPIVKMVIALFSLPDKGSVARIAPSAEGASFKRLKLWRNPPFHFRIGQSGGPHFAWLDRNL